MIVSPVVILPFAAAAVLFALLKPKGAILLPLLVHPLYLVRSSIGPLPTTALELILMSVVVGCALGAWRSFRRPYPLPPVPYTLVILFLLAAALSVFVSPHLKTSLGVLKAMVIEPAAYAVTLFALLRTPAERTRILHALVVGGLVAVVLSLAAIVYNLPPTTYNPFTFDFGRFRGIYDVPNSLALVVAPLIPLALVMAWRAASRAQRLAHGVATVVFSGALLATQSLGGLAAVVTVLLPTAYYLLPRSHLRRMVLVVVLIACLLIGGLLIQFSTGKLAHASRPLQSRLEIWQVSLALIRDHPILGVGLGTFEPAYQTKLRQLFTGNMELGTTSSQSPVLSSQFPLEWVVRDPHNLLLSFWLNTGLLGLLAMGGLVALALHLGFRVAPSTSYTLQLTTLALLTALLFGFVDVPYFKNDLALLWWTYVVMALADTAPATSPVPSR